MNFEITVTESPEDFGGMFAPLKYRFEQKGVQASSYSISPSGTTITTTASNIQDIKDSGTTKLLIRMPQVYELVKIEAIPSTTQVRIEKVIALGQTVYIGIPKTLRLAVLAGYSDAWNNPTGSLFDKPVERLADIELPPHPRRGDYELDVAAVLQTYNETRQSPVGGLSTSLSLMYRLEWTENVGGSEQTAQSSLKTALYGNPDSYQPFLKTVPLYRRGVINFVDEQGYGKPLFYSRIDQGLNAIENVKQDKTRRISTSSADVYFLTGAKYILEVVLPNNAGTINLLGAPSWVQNLGGVPTSPNILQLEVAPPTSGDPYGFSAADFDAGDFDTTVSAVGSYDVQIENNGQVEAQIGVKIMEANAVREIDPDRPQYSLTWLNPEGGFSTFYFVGNKDYGLEVGDRVTYKDKNEIKRIAELKNTRERVLVRSQPLTSTESLFLSSLWVSPAVYEFNEETGEYDQPVNILRDDVVYFKDRYRAGNELIEFEVERANELKLQRI